MSGNDIGIVGVGNRKDTIIILFFLSIISFSDSCGQEKLSDNSSKTVVHVLFIGNSLTYTNNLPDLVVKRAEMQVLWICRTAHQ